jgi:hypothetical protein
MAEGRKARHRAFSLVEHVRRSDHGLCKTLRVALAIPKRFAELGRELPRPTWMPRSAARFKARSIASSSMAISFRLRCAANIMAFRIQAAARKPNGSAWGAAVRATILEEACSADPKCGSGRVSSRETRVSKSPGPAERSPISVRKVCTKPAAGWTTRGMK